MTISPTATTINTTSPASFTCSQCPFARLIEDNRYCCQVSQTASDVKRGHWEATVSCFEALAKAEAEKVAEVEEAPIAQAVALEAIGTDNKPPNRDDNGHGRVLLIAKTNKKLAAIFTNRPKQYQQFLIIREELAAIGIKLGKLIKSREDVKGWRLDWDGDKAGLYWMIGNGWEIASLKYETELTGNWEGFDLMEYLDCNGIELPE